MQNKNERFEESVTRNFQARNRGSGAARTDFAEKRKKRNQNMASMPTCVDIGFVEDGSAAECWFCEAEIEELNVKVAAVTEQGQLICTKWVCVCCAKKRIAEEVLECDLRCKGEQMWLATHSEDSLDGCCGDNNAQRASMHFAFGDYLILENFTISSL